MIVRSLNILENKVHTSKNVFNNNGLLNWKLTILTLFDEL